jgi:hypothetical protein
MSVVQPTNSALPSMPTEPAGMSADSLMAYCSTRLTTLDTQMQQIFNQQTQSAATITDLNNVSSALNDLPAPSNDSPPTITMTRAQYDQINHVYYMAIDDLSPKGGTPGTMYGGGVQTALGKELQTDQEAFTSGCKIYASGDVKVPASVITNITQNLKTYTSSLNSDAEMQMIDLQSLMSSRQTAVQLSTNMMQAMSTTDQSIVSNLKPG